MHGKPLSCGFRTSLTVHRLKNSFAWPKKQISKFPSATGRWESLSCRSEIKCCHCRKALLPKREKQLSRKLMDQPEILSLLWFPAVIGHTKVQVFLLILFRHRPGHRHILTLPLGQLVVIIISCTRPGRRSRKISRSAGYDCNLFGGRIRVSQHD